MRGSEKKIRDLVEIPDVKTVIQMSDIENSELRDFLTESFLLTSEVAVVFKTIFTDMMHNRGKGYFLEGNFGSGKSHLLSVLSLLLTYDRAWEPLLAQETEIYNLLSTASEELGKSNFLVLNISLVEHSNKEYLEDIVTDRIRKKLQEKGEGQFSFAHTEEFMTKMHTLLREQYPGRLKTFLREKDLEEDELFLDGNLSLVEEMLERFHLPYRFKYDRREIFSLLSRVMKEENYRGLVILIDELSEFLRSRTDGRRFNEDIRFLQFLGEFCQKESAWVMASLQEEIEKTGETTPEAFNKIKDRYPTRFYLTGAHIKELVSKRLISLKPGAQEEIKGIYNFYQDSFPGWPVGEEEFIDLYPVHPMAISLLDNLKPLFSRHRGIVDFIHYRLQGDPGRSIEGMLNLSVRELLTADKIFDHFTDRIREKVETNAYYEKVYNYYRQEIDSFLPEEDRETGLQLIKLLILFAISPVAKEYTARDMAHMLLAQLTDLDPEVNYDYIDGLLTRLYNQGAYIVKKEGEKKTGNIYTLDLEADVNLLVEKKLKYIKSNLFASDRRLFTRTARLVKEEYLPLADLLAEPETMRTVTWQNTERSGYLWFSSLTDISPGKLKEIGEKMASDEDDFILLIAYPLDVDEEKDYLKKVLLPEIRGTAQQSVVFWLPATLENSGFLQEMLSRLLLLDEYREDNTDTGIEIREKVWAMITEEKDKLYEIFREAYFQGIVFNGTGEEIIAINKEGLLPFHRLVEKIVFRLLSKRFPDHVNIAPHYNYLSANQVQELEEKFLVRGEISREELSPSLERTVSSFLKPLGVIRENNSGYRLRLKSDKNQLIRKYFAALEEERTPLSEIYLKLRKGSYGLCKRQFQLLTTCLLYGGYLTAYSEQQKISLQRFKIQNFGRIKYLGRGELIAGDFQDILKECVLLPPRFQKQPFSLPLQQDIWEYLSDKKRSMMEEIEAVKFKINDLKSGELLAPFNPEKMLNYLEKVADILSEIKVSYSAEEGLERFASYYRSQPHSDNYLRRFSAIRDFMEEGINSYRKMKSYLGDEDLYIPDEEKYASLQRYIRNLQESLTEEALVYDKDYLAKVKQAFHDFQGEYIELYSEEHNQQLGGERYQPTERIKKSKAYRILQLLAEIELISVKNDLVKAERMIARNLSRSCHRISTEGLKSKPLCSCGFKLGTEVDLISVKEIQKVLRTGIIEYLHNLQEEENKNKLEEYLLHMEDAGEKRFARPLREILKLEVKSGFLDKLEKNLNRNVIKRINKALAGDITLVERNLDSLYENLVDRSFTPEQVKDIFQEWLQGVEGLRQGSYVKIVSRETGSDAGHSQEAGDEEIAEEILNRYYPELLPIFAHCGLGRFALIIAYCDWQDKHGLVFPPEVILAGDSRLQEFIYDEQGQLVQEKNFQSLVQSIFTEADFEQFRDLVLEYGEEKIEEEAILDLLLEKLELSTILHVLRAIKCERFSLSLLKALLLRLFRMVENGQQEAVVLQKGIILLEKKTGKNLDTQKEMIIEAALYYLKLEHASSLLEAEQELSSFTDWVEIYQKQLAFCEYWFARIKKLGRELQLVDKFPLNLKEKVITGQLKKQTKEFAVFYRSQDPAAENLTLPVLIKEKYPQLLQRLNTEQGFMILLDGLRWDLWEIIRKKLCANISLRIIEEGFHLAVEPTNTETQIELLRDSGFQGEIVSYSYLERDLKADREQIIKFSFIDDKVHSSYADYSSFVEEIDFSVEQKLIPFIERLPAGSPLLFFGDHGFRINYNFRKGDKFKTPRYLHGGGSPFEVFVPWAVLYKV